MNKYFPKLILFFAVLLSVTLASGQDFSVPGSDGESGTQAENPADASSQIPATLALKARPIVMLANPVTWNFYRTANGEVECMTSERTSFSFGFNYAFFDSEQFFPDDDSLSVELSALSFRLEGRYYFKKKKPKDSYYTGEGLFLGGYYKGVFDVQNFTDPAEQDSRSFSNILGVTFGYQSISTKRIIVSPFIGLGLGVSTLSTGEFGIRPDVRAGLTFGYLAF